MLIVEGRSTLRRGLIRPTDPLTSLRKGPPTRRGKACLFRAEEEVVTRLSSPTEVSLAADEVSRADMVLAGGHLAGKAPSVAAAVAMTEEDK